MILFKVCHVGDKVRYATEENGQRFLADGVITKVKEDHAIMTCDGGHGWDKDIKLWIDGDTAFDFYSDFDRPW